MDSVSVSISISVSVIPFPDSAFRIPCFSAAGIYTHTLIAEVNRKINLLSWASMNTAYYNLGLSQGGIFSLQWELVYKTDKIPWT